MKKAGGCVDLKTKQYANDAWLPSASTFAIEMG